MTDFQLWYASPGQSWTDALPLGNGRLGAMVYGGVGRDELQLNEATLWSGGPYQPSLPDARVHLDTVRDLIFAGRYAEAQSLADQHLMARPLSQMSYQPAGNLFVEWGHEAVPGSHRRSLDLETAIATTAYRLLGTGIEDDAPHFRRETFVSAADDVLVHRLEGSRPHSLSFELWLDSPQPGDWLQVEGSSIAYRGQNFGMHGMAGQLRFGIDVDVRTDTGTIEQRGRRLVIRNASAATIIVDIATSFRRFDDVSGDPDQLLGARRHAIADKDYAQLKSDHLSAYGALFGRMRIDLGSARSDLPTDERIARYARGGDPGLAALYVQYGRYLALASSRPGTQPANLQGIWNAQTSPPWGSKYTANINLQMNYWMADAANLPECVEPLIALVEDLATAGTRTAQLMYGARGWVLHHNTDLWRATGPIDGAQWGLWPMGGAWLCAQLWDHALYAGRPEALVRRILPLISGAVRFALDILQPLPGTGYLVTVPSISPENVHPLGASLCAGPAMDSQILRDLFGAYLEASAQLGLTEPMQEDVRLACERLPADRIGAEGQLQEWLDDWDMQAPEREHRHVSHLYGLYPSLQISPEITPALAQAAERSLTLRGDNATGWGLGWRINLWARLRKGDHAHKVLGMLINPERSYPNLFDAHPPFQIDGNFGGAAGILEMLVQSREDRIDLLPALPSDWPRGCVEGIRVRGDVSLNFSWCDGRLASLVAMAPKGYAGRVCSGGKVLRAGLPAGTTVIIESERP